MKTAEHTSANNGLPQRPFGPCPPLRDASLRSASVILKRRLTRGESDGDHHSGVSPV